MGRWLLVLRAVLYFLLWVLMVGMWRITRHHHVKIAFPPEERAQRYWDQVIEGEANALLFLLMSAFMTVVNYMFRITAEALYLGLLDDDDDGDDSPSSPRPTRAPTPKPTYTYSSTSYYYDDDDAGDASGEVRGLIFVPLIICGLLLVGFIININTRLQNVRELARMEERFAESTRHGLGKYHPSTMLITFTGEFCFWSPFLFAVIIIIHPDEVYAQMVYGLVISILFFVYAAITSTQR